MSVKSIFSNASTKIAEEMKDINALNDKSVNVERLDWFNKALSKDKDESVDRKSSSKSVLGKLFNTDKSLANVPIYFDEDIYGKSSRDMQLGFDLREGYDNRSVRQRDEDNYYRACRELVSENYIKELSEKYGKSTYDIRKGIVNSQKLNDGYIADARTHVGPFGEEFVADYKQYMTGYDKYVTSLCSGVEEARLSGYVANLKDLISVRESNVYKDVHDEAEGQLNDYLSNRRFLEQLKDNQFVSESVYSQVRTALYAQNEPFVKFIASAYPASDEHDFYWKDLNHELIGKGKNNKLKEISDDVENKLKNVLPKRGHEVIVEEPVDTFENAQSNLQKN